MLSLSLHTPTSPGASVWQHLQRGSSPQPVSLLGFKMSSQPSRGNKVSCQASSPNSVPLFMPWSQLWASLGPFLEYHSLIQNQETSQRNTYEMVIVTVKYSIYTKPLSLAGFTGWFLRYATEPSRLSLFSVELCLSQDSTTHQQASVKHISTSTQLWVSASIMGFKNKVQSGMKKKLRTRNISLRWK